MDRHEVTIDTYNKAAKNYQDKFMSMDLYDDTYDKFCNLIEKKNAEVLEIGCGPGNVTKYLLNKRPDLIVTGIDLAPNMIELAKVNCPAASFQLLDCRDIDKLGKKYNAIIGAFCMPYLSREECAKLIFDSSKLLETNGLVYFSTMEGDYSKSGFETTSFSGPDKVYIYYHQAAFLEKELVNNNFQIIEIQRKDYPEPDGTFLTDMIFIAKKRK